MHTYICVTCGTFYPPSAQPPAHCPICEDDRQYLNWQGQTWTTPEEMQGKYHNVFEPIEPGVTGIRSEPSFAIGQQAQLIQTPAGNVLWDCISHLDDETIERVNALGGIAAITGSHPHLYAGMVAWSRAFNAPIYLHADNRPWVMNPDESIVFWEGETKELLPGVTTVRCAGHFPGSAALHWAGGAEGRGALFAADTIMVVSDRRYVSFMYSYPNLIPMNAAAVRQIVAAVEPFDFERLYSSWPGKVVAEDAKAAVRRSAERYIAHIQ